MNSENLSSLIRFSVSDGQKTESSKIVSFILVCTVCQDKNYHQGQKYIIFKKFLPEISSNKNEP